MLLPCAGEYAFHLLHSPGQSGQHCLRDYRMTDIQFMNVRQGGNRMYIVIIQPMPGIDLQTSRNTERNGATDPKELIALLCSVRGVGVISGMKFNDAGTGRHGRFYLAGLRINK